MVQFKLYSNVYSNRANEINQSYCIKCFLFATYKPSFFYYTMLVQNIIIAFKVHKLDLWISWLLHYNLPIQKSIIDKASKLPRNAVNTDSRFEEEVMSWHLVLSFCQMLGQHWQSAGCTEFFSLPCRSFSFSFPACPPERINISAISQ